MGDKPTTLATATSDGVPYREFRQLAAEYARDFPEGKTDRLDEGVLHFNERYTIELVD